MGGRIGNINAIPSNEKYRGIAFSISGTLTTGYKAMFTVPCVLIIIKVIMRVKTAPTGADIICDVHKISKGSTESTTIFSTQENRPTITIDEYEEESLVPDIVSVDKNDTLEFYIDQIGSIVAGADLATTIVCEVA